MDPSTPMDGAPKPLTQNRPAVKIENVAGENLRPFSPPDNGSSLMIDSDEEDDELSNENDDDLESWRSMERRSSIEGIDCEDDLGISMENKNTQRKTDTDIRIFITYLRSINEFRAPELISPMHLDGYLSAFFSVVKKHDGNEYEPASLRGMLCSVERYLKLKNYPQSVTRDSAFSKTRNALKFKQQKLRELGKGTKKPPEPFGRLSLDKVNHLFSAHEMGPYTPMSVINTLCFLFIIHFRLRKAIDHKNLLWGDIRLKTDPNGKKYLAYQPMDSQNPGFQDKFDHHRLWLYEQPDIPERDPVAIYNLYTERRHSSMKYDNSPFYLGITSMQPSPLQAWYRTCAMGVNKLSDLVRMIRDITGLPRAAMNGPTEYILSESYGRVSSGNQDKNIPVLLPADTRHSKVFSQNSQCHPLQIKTESSTMNDRRPQPITINIEDRNQKSADDVELIDTKDSNYSLQSDVPWTETDSSTDEMSSGRNLISLPEAKEKTETILQSLDHDDKEEFKKWLLSLLSEEITTSKVPYEKDDSNQTQNTNKPWSFPTISLNIKISPGAITGSSPISVVADFKPTITEEESGLDATKRKSNDIECDQGYSKRLKESDSLRPVNLSSETFRKRTSGTPNTAVVLPRSEKTDISNQSAQNDKEVPPRVINDISSYVGSVSYPYVPCTDPRMFVNGNVFPQFAHSNMNSNFPFQQPVSRNLSIQPKPKNADKS